MHDFTKLDTVLAFLNAVDQCGEKRTGELFSMSLNRVKQLCEQFSQYNTLKDLYTAFATPVPTKIDRDAQRRLKMYIYHHFYPMG